MPSWISCPKQSTILKSSFTNKHTNSRLLLSMSNSFGNQVSFIGRWTYLLILLNHLNYGRSCHWIALRFAAHWTTLNSTNKVITTKQKLKKKEYLSTRPKTKTLNELFNHQLEMHMNDGVWLRFIYAWRNWTNNNNGIWNYTHNSMIKMKMNEIWWEPCIVKTGFCVFIKTVKWLVECV